MNKRISFIFILIFSCLNLFAQTEKSTSPVKWERYKISSSEVSINLPKMPVSTQFSDDCNELETVHYAVYAEETVYQFVIASKSKQKISFYCPERKNFGSVVFENNIERLKQILEDVEKINSVEQTKLTINEKEVTKLIGKFTTHWVFNDLKNNKWIVLSISNRQNNSIREKKFINSINFDKNSSGIEIGNGAELTLGDEEKAVENKLDKKSQLSEDVGKDDSLRTVFKPRANYTEEARKNQTQGTVMLRVTFLANGAIGAVSPITFLPDGLTEQAKIAASKIVFLPQMVKGKTVNVTKQVHYSFTIY